VPSFPSSHSQPLLSHSLAQSVLTLPHLRFCRGMTVGCAKSGTLNFFEIAGCRLYGFAQLGVAPSPVLLEAVAQEARRQLPAFGPQVRQ